MINVNLVLICGIPACGKSFLLNEIQSLFTNIQVFQFDVFFEENYKNDYSCFKEAQVKFVIYLENQFKNQVKQWSSSKSSKSIEIFFFVEDNFPQRSNRKLLYNTILNLNVHFSYLEIHFRPNLNISIERNKFKLTPIPEKIIKSMIDHYELKPIKDYFEIIIIEEQYSTKDLYDDIKSKLKCNENVINDNNELLIMKDKLLAINFSKSEESKILDKIEIQMKKIISNLLNNFQGEQKSFQASKYSSLKKEYYSNIKRQLKTNSNIINDVFDEKDFELYLSK